jgi:hypothetical protein
MDFQAYLASSSEDEEEVEEAPEGIFESFHGVVNRTMSGENLRRPPNWLQNIFIHIELYACICMGRCLKDWQDAHWIKALIQT